MPFLNTISAFILNVIFPIKCLICGKRGEDLCRECLGNSPAAERESEKWIFPALDYRHPSIKKALWFFKYKGKKRLAGTFAQILYEKMIEELSELSVMENFREPILIPIPLSPKRYRERGYNQAELICRELVKINPDFILASGVLIKPKDTEHQARIRDRGKRLKNLSGSFAVKYGASIRKRNIILIDDITTTGATLTEARKILRQAGAGKIIAFTVAH